MHRFDPADPVAAEPPPAGRKRAAVARADFERTPDGLVSCDYPTWPRLPASASEAAFSAGAGLALLDRIIRPEPPCAIPSVLPPEARRPALPAASSPYGAPSPSARRGWTRQGSPQPPRFSTCRPISIGDARRRPSTCARGPRPAARHAGDRRRRPGAESIGIPEIMRGPAAPRVESTNSNPQISAVRQARRPLFLNRSHFPDASERLRGGRFGRFRPALLGFRILSDKRRLSDMESSRRVRRFFRETA